MADVAGNVRFIHREDLNLGRWVSKRMLSKWLDDYIAALDEYARGHERSELEAFPHSLYLLDVVGFAEYGYTPQLHTMEEIFERIALSYDKNCLQYLDMEPERTTDYIADHYFSQTDVGIRAAMSIYFLNCCFSRQDERGYIIGYSVYDDLLTVDNRRFWMYDEEAWVNKNKLSDALLKYTDILKQTAASYYKSDFENELPYSYKLLKKFGDGIYYQSGYDIAYKSRDAVQAAAILVNAVKNGLGITDDNSKEYYVRSVDCPASLRERVGEDFGEALISQAEGFKKLDDWYEYFSKYLSDDILKSFLVETENFIIVDGYVYTTGYREWYDLREFNKYSIKVSGQKDGKTVLTAEGGPIYGAFIGTDYTFEVYEDDTGVRITGGTFVELFMEKGITRAKAAASVYGVLYAYDIFYNGNAEKYSSFMRLNDSSEYDDFCKVNYIKYKTDFKSYPVYVSTIMEYRWVDNISVLFDTDITDYVTPKFTNEKSAVFSDPAYGYLFVIPSGAAVRNEPVFGGTKALSFDVVCENLDIKLEKNGTAVVSVNMESGGRLNTYTVQLKQIYGRVCITGGTFVDELIK